MSEELKKENQDQEVENEINLEDLENVTGGGLKDVYYKPTKDIDESIRERI